jgi:hypothetical protein
VLSTQPTCGTSYAPGSNVGPYTTTCSGAAAANYAISYASGGFNVTKKALMITADNKSKQYDGAAFTAFTAQYSGFVMGQNESALGGTLTFSGNAVGATTVGSYTITPGGRTSGNYQITPANGTLTIGSWYVTGFFEPVGIPNSITTAPGATLPYAPSVWNTIKGGQTVPLKFRLFTSQNGTELTSVANVQGFYLANVACSAGPEDPITDGTFTTTGGTALRYDTTDHQFIQNWDSAKGAGKCYRVTMTAKDGTSITAFFKTK